MTIQRAHTLERKFLPYTQSPARRQLALRLGYPSRNTICISLPPTPYIIHSCSASCIFPLTYLGEIACFPRGLTTSPHSCGGPPTRVSVVALRVAVLSLTWSPSGIRLSPATTNSSDQQLSSSEHTCISAEVSAGHGPRSTTALVTRCVPLNSKTLPNCLPKRVHKFKLTYCQTDLY